MVVLQANIGHVRIVEGMAVNFFVERTPKAVDVCLFVEHDWIALNDHLAVFFGSDIYWFALETNLLIQFLFAHLFVPP